MQKEKEKQKENEKQKEKEHQKAQQKQKVGAVASMPVPTLPSDFYTMCQMCKADVLLHMCAHCPSCKHAFCIECLRRGGEFNNRGNVHKCNCPVCKASMTKLLQSIGL